MSRNIPSHLITFSLALLLAMLWWLSAPVTDVPKNSKSNVYQWYVANAGHDPLSDEELKSELHQGAFANLGFSDDSGRLIGFGSTIAGPNEMGLWPSFAATSALYEAYTDHSKKLGRRYPLSTSEFGKRFIQLAKVSSIRPNIYGSRVRGYDMPSLNNARREFCKFLGHELVWE